MKNIEKKILLTADDSLSARNAVRYCVRMSAYIKNLTYTLFHVQPPVSGFLVDEAKTNMKARSELAKINKKNAREAKEMLEELKSDMVGMGIEAERIETRTASRKMGLAKDLIEHAQEGKYDALVVGRRGYSRVQEVFMGSLTAKLAEHSQVIPLWIIDGKVESDKILVAVDGSISALKAVDHVSFITGGSSDVDITLVHVISKMRDYCPIDSDDSDGEAEYIISQGDKRCIENFMVHAYDRFRKAGVQDERIQLKEIHKTVGGVGKAVLKEAKNGGYGTVVLGRRGLNKSFFTDSVSSQLFSRTTDCAVWLVT